MELLVIIALLASNIFLIGRVLKKPDTPTGKTGTPAPSESPSVQHDTDDDDLIGRSHVDMDHINALIDAKVNSKVEEKVDEIVTRVKTELTSPEDVGLPAEESDKESPATATIPQEKLDEAFTHHSVGETFGESPVSYEPVPGGQDFKALESAVRVAKDEPHTPEEAVAARETLKGIEGTQLAERLSLDPKVRTRILTIIYGDEDEELSKEVIAKKKVVYSKTIDTFDVDQINLNILS